MTVLVSPIGVNACRARRVRHSIACAPSTNASMPPARRMGLRQLTLRGKIKARIHLLWFAVAHNMMRFLALHAKAQAAL